MKRIILLAVVAMLSAFTLSAQTVEDVVSRAKGGDVEAQNELALSYFDGAIMARLSSGGVRPPSSIVPRRSIA